MQEASGEVGERQGHDDYVSRVNGNLPSIAVW